MASRCSNRVEMRIDKAGAHAVQSQKTADDAQGIFMIRDGGRDLDPVAGGKDDGFGGAALLELAKSVRNGVFGNGELFPELYRRRFVADSGDEQLH